LIIDGEKMSKSLGNFYTLRDLLKKGHKPSTIRYMLASVPYRRQLNFTGESIQQAASSVERLRNFVARIKEGKFPAGANPGMAAQAQKAEADFEAGLADDLNTAVALAAIFDLVRDVNTAIDRCEFHQQDAPHVLAAMKKFDAIFAVIEDNDAAKVRALGFESGAPEMDAAEIDALVAERQRARKERNFKRADEIRQELAERGILLEDTREGGIRWKKK
jgi:cysteinyl-tRNA synthetase